MEGATLADKRGRQSRWACPPAGGRFVDNYMQLILITKHKMLPIKVNLYSSKHFIPLSNTCYAECHANEIYFKLISSRSELKTNWKKLVQGQVIYHLNRHSELYKNIP